MEKLSRLAADYLETLCARISNRSVGAPGNKLATRFFREVMEENGLAVESQPFDCIDFRSGEIHLQAGGQEFESHISPYSLGCDVTAELISASTIKELEELEARGKLLLLHGPIAKEQLMPKNFVFYNPEDHQKIYKLLEEKNPAAIISATHKNPDAVGAVYPYPMIEDGDFDIPNAYTTEKIGETLLGMVNREFTLFMDAERVPSTGENIIAQFGDPSHQKTILCAHIDARYSTPGALDNASGTVILMLLSHLLKDFQGNTYIEIVALNGEEYFNTPGQIKYLQSISESSGKVLLAVNLDDIGYKNDRTAYSLYGVPEYLTSIIHNAFRGHEILFEGPPWYQGDHGVFISKEIPAMALTEESFASVMAEFTHTEKDIPAIVNPETLVETATALYDLLRVVEK
jgi:aminopeptidase YwaD